VNLVSLLELRLGSLVGIRLQRLKECAMTERRRKTPQTRPLEERMAEQAAKLKEQASLLPAGRKREELLKRVRIAETGLHISDWLTSPGQQPPD